MPDAALLEQQLGTLELLRAVYCAEGELTLEADTERVVSEAERWLASRASPPPAQLASGLPLLLTLRTEDNWQLPTSLTGPELQVDIFLPPCPFSGSGHERPGLRLRQPAWLSRAEHDQLAASLLPPAQGEGSAEDEDEVDSDDLTYIMSSIDRLHSALRSLAPTLSLSPTPTADLPTPPVPLSPTVLRTWHHLPSLSTRSKRAELVTYATSHTPALTGFVLAGKPGLVVLEHPLPPSPSPSEIASASTSLDSYWSTIKSHSWADIPSSHKKVSERLREVAPRAWRAMSEVTRSEEVGGPRMAGEKANRQDVASVGRWLDGLGLGGRLERVLGAEWR
ncbi:hypothetical protein CALVIDRAFT_260045 [Calocera viscosa TUFC12733]|uniref:RWD domain-containing protein n=1 Tax=Calocera viscosa (strain TUFC12733) TaxID=1330018 RepID=A0A167J384_CALVF|nr:hypothetical protein CALVIDRAFT_260045 [Calocera viscosa TUFC12733]